jgi:hypothetical protein
MATADERKGSVAKKRADKELYDRMRASGVRKKVARQLAELPRHVTNGKRAPKPVRDAVERLQTVVEELRGHADTGTRSTAARKAARTRRSQAASRSASARKSARTRAKQSSSASSGKAPRTQTSRSTGARKTSRTRAKS